MTGLVDWLKHERCMTGLVDWLKHELYLHRVFCSAIIAGRARENVTYARGGAMFPSHTQL